MQSDTNDDEPIEGRPPPSIGKTDDDEVDLLVPTDIWNRRLQDKGVTLAGLPSKTYRQSKIDPIGPKENAMYYPELSATAIDMSKVFYTEQSLGTGWAKVPKNKTDVKKKIIGRLLAMRKLGDDNAYHLEQSVLLDMLQNVWGRGAHSATIHSNDRARVYGIVMSIEENRPIYERLSVGVQGRSDLDDVSMSLQQIFQTVGLAFNNEEVILNLPDEAYDIPNFDSIDLNDMSRIRISRDCMLQIIGNYIMSACLFHDNILTNSCIM